VPQIEALRIAAGQHTSLVGVCLALKTKLLAHVIAPRQGGRDFVKRISPLRSVRFAHEAQRHAESVTLLPLNGASLQSSSWGQFQQDLTLVAFHASTDHQSRAFHRVNHLAHSRFADSQESSQLTGRVTIAMTQKAKDLYAGYAHVPTDAIPNGAGFQHFFDGPGKHQQALEQPINRVEGT